MNLLEIKGLSKHFEGINALADFSCSLHEGETIGLLGPNGAGKTTLFNIICGFIRADSGHIFYKGKKISSLKPYRIANLGISRTFQNLRIIGKMSLLDNVLLSFRKQRGESIVNLFLEHKCIKTQEEINRLEAFELLKEVGLYENCYIPAEELSYGQQKLLSIICCLAANPNILLLDEPIAGIAPEMIDKILDLIRKLSSKGISVIMIEHNIDAVMQLCSRVIFMNAGVVLSEGTPNQVRNDPKVISAYLSR